MSNGETHLDLALDASEGSLLIVWMREGEVLVAQDWRLPHASTEVLAPTLASTAALLGQEPGRFGRIACVTGPGSFTGIRLILTTAQALRRIRPVLLAALNGLQVLALCLARRLAPTEPSRICSVTHARKNLVHAQSFLFEGRGLPEPLGDIVLASPSEVVERAPAGTLFCGSALAHYPEIFSQSSVGRAGGFFPDTQRIDAESLAYAAGCAAYLDRDLEPLYVRSVDALDHLTRLAGRQGIEESSAWSSFERLTQGSPQSLI